ncbi:ATP-binding cassette domain-containing protein [Acidobacteria bacterium AH-259-D05]|nr:ATP-binding cassette domain-containing protein [Acidobacteria bacterium AH-259-D05]
METHALVGIHLEIHSGEFVAIDGPSGCGKSTLLSIMGLLDSPTEGEYFLSTRPVASLSVKERTRLRNREIGFIFQNYNLIGDLTVYENVELYEETDGAAQRSESATGTVAGQNVKLKPICRGPPGSTHLTSAPNAGHKKVTPFGKSSSLTRFEGGQTIPHHKVLGKLGVEEWTSPSARTSGFPAVLLSPQFEVGLIQIVTHFGKLAVAGVLGSDFRGLGGVVNHVFEGTFPGREMKVGRTL